MLTPTRHRTESEVCEGFRASRKGMYEAVESYAIEHGFEVMVEKVEGMPQAKDVTYVCADHRIVVGNSGCKFRVETERRRRFGQEDLEITRFVADHGTMCSGGPIPTPSFEYLCKHTGRC